MQVYNAMHYVYRHIRLDTGQPFYIGMGKDPDFKRAYSKRNRNNYWHNIVKSAGYRVEILLDNLFFEEACDKEKEFIALYGRGSTGLLCNITEGGMGLKNPTEETLKKISLSKLGSSNPQFGKKWTLDKREKMKARMSGKNNPNYGKSLSDAQKKQISVAQQGRQKSNTEKEAIYSKIRIQVIDLETGIFYSSINEAAETYGVPDYTMSRWLKNPKKKFKKI
jgi:group I intron endonuclease